MDKKPQKQESPKPSRAMLGKGMARGAADALVDSKRKREKAAGLKAGGTVKRGYGAARCR